MEKETLQALQSTDHHAAAAGAGELAPWFHNLHFPDGTRSAPGHPLGDFPNLKWQQIEAHVPQSLDGWRALDIGCNAGFYSFALAARGADVTGLELDEHYLRQARWAVGRFPDLRGSVQFRKGSVYDLARMEERFDLVLFMGVFYHLRHPLLALDLVAEKTERLLIFQTLTMPGEGQDEAPGDLPLNRRNAMLKPAWPKMAFIEHHLAGDPTNWWAPNTAACRAMLRSAGMEVSAEPGHEIFVARPAEESKYQRDQRIAELDAASGRRT